MTTEAQLVEDFEKAMKARGMNAVRDVEAMVTEIKGWSRVEWLEVAMLLCIRPANEASRAALITLLRRHAQESDQRFSRCTS